jgi:hypothetical protein
MSGVTTRNTNMKPYKSIYKENNYRINENKTYIIDNKTLIQAIEDKRQNKNMSFGDPLDLCISYFMDYLRKYSKKDFKGYSEYIIYLDNSIEIKIKFKKTKSNEGYTLINPKNKEEEGYVSNKQLNEILNSYPSLLNIHKKVVDERDYLIVSKSAIQKLESIIYSKHNVFLDELVPIDIDLESLKGNKFKNFYKIIFKKNNDITNYIKEYLKNYKA